MVACEIYHFNINNQPIWYSKLVSQFEGKLSKLAVSHALDVLADWGISFGEYGCTENGRAGYCLYIYNFDGHGDDPTGEMIKELYEKYWRDEREEKTC